MPTRRLLLIVTLLWVALGTELLIPVTFAFCPASSARVLSPNAKKPMIQSPTGFSSSKTTTTPPLHAYLMNALGQDESGPLLIQGHSLRTFPVDDRIEGVAVSLTTQGRPLNAKIELWHGPDYTATTTRIYIEDGALRPFNGVIATPKNSNTVALYNVGEMEFPFSAVVEGDIGDDANPLTSLTGVAADLLEHGVPDRIQGGRIVSYPFDESVERVQILLKTEGRNLKARIELMQGPNTDKQVIEFYASDGYKRPFFAIIESPGSGNVVRIINEQTVEFPFMCYVEPFEFAEYNGGVSPPLIE